MTKEKIENNDSENVDEEVETSEEETTEEEESEDEEKEEETSDDSELSDREKQFLARAKKAEAKLKAKKSEKTEKKPSKKETSESLDYGQKAYLRAEGIKRGAEQDLIEEFMESGKSLEDILESRAFQAELKTLREDAKVKEATPKSPKRSSSTSRDKVDYWLNKGELPPIDEVELRRKVVNARLKKETSGSNFTTNPTGSVTVK